jgi:hypothetical protein
VLLGAAPVAEEFLTQTSELQSVRSFRLKRSARRVLHKCLLCCSTMAKVGEGDPRYVAVALPSDLRHGDIIALYLASTCVEFARTALI